MYKNLFRRIKGVFNGKIMVRQDNQDRRFQSNNLLLAITLQLTVNLS